MANCTWQRGWLASKAAHGSVGRVLRVVCHAPSCSTPLLAGCDLCIADHLAKTLVGRPGVARSSSASTKNASISRISMPVFRTGGWVAICVMAQVR